MTKIINGIEIPMTADELLELEILKSKVLAEQAKQSILDDIQVNKDYLSSTDWEVTKALELGTVTSTAIATARAEARTDINRLEGTL